MINESEKIRNYSIALLCVAATFFLIFCAIYLNNKIKAQQDLISKVEEIKTELSLNFNKVYDDYKFANEEQRKLELSFKEDVENAGQVLNGIITIFSARIMEEERMISKSDADLLVIDSISKIKKSNQTLAELISIINRNWINKR
tara:strand:- start:256 stop:690 length:435 start_codon:yes stop_codon:yes gene_type:complete